MPRGRGGRGGSGHNYQGSGHLYVPKSKREQPTTAPATTTTTTTRNLWQSEKPVCRFFQRGQCNRGEKCTFPHPADQEGIHARTEAANPFTAGQKNPAPNGDIPCSGESANSPTTRGSPNAFATSNAGDDVHMCDCSGDQAQELATLRLHLAATKHIIETLCQGDAKLESRAKEMIDQYNLKL